MQEEVFQKVAELIAADIHIPVETITMESTFEDLNMDSLDGITLVNNLETHYNILIPNEQAMKLRSVSEVIDSLERLLKDSNNESK
ncbi:MAG: acyl carrier protein [Bacteroidia bacterium]|nr:acyl carrier protein [Bacteroidia bacterium]